MTTIPTDTLFSEQWYLYNVTIGEYDINVTAVWDDYTGKGVKVMVIDDGFDYTHPDLAANYDDTADYDLTNEDGDPTPRAPQYQDMHGTPVMGLIGAARNDVGIVGVAYGATLVGARLSYESGLGVFLNQWIAGLDAAREDGTDIVNMSFDYNNASDVNLQIGEMYLVDALQRSVDEGRDGLGTILVRSAGNLDPWNDMIPAFGVNGNQLNANSLQVTVGAIMADGFSSIYSSEGTHLLISAFGSSIPGDLISTDRQGNEGYTTGDYLPDFNGTSAAAPMVSGVVALMLEANPHLGWRDVQTILAYSARHVGSAIDGTTTSATESNPWLWNGATNWNGGGLHFNTAYGFGLVDAHAAVRLAETWAGVATSSNEQHLSLDLLAQNTSLADATDGRVFAAELTQSISVERVVVTFDAISLGDATVEITLTSPDGQEISLSHLPHARGYYGPVSYHSQALRGELSAGEWEVRIDSDDATEEALLRDIRIDIYGAKVTRNDSYVYTDEFSEYAGDGHAIDLADTNGGVDLLNAVAVTSAIAINLAAKTGTIDGVAMTIAGVENIFGGDGEDTLTGSKGDNIIAGGRGADTVLGGKGDDRFRFFGVFDSASSGAGQDVFGDFGKGNDVFDLRSIDANINTAKNDKFRFIGEHDLTGVAGQLHFQRSGGVTFAGGDVDGDGDVDILFSIDGNHKLVKGDFDL
ncbi:S8 family serine peptidase [Rhizobium sp. TH2]|uniref:S8 family serine peptidase n=1 Tax=Rhizobium sp. TH2 TaxID=2775403 RepID=UPI002157C287|nr:S8 family serine peptidase [Rhizobium sp. TH2]UVC10238.1 S8 family serine peptidase [Rhizobium sp. TH2]